MLIRHVDVDALCTEKPIDTACVTMVNGPNEIPAVEELGLL